MDTLKVAELKVLIAADHWARDMLREERTLKHVERHLLDAILVYLKVIKATREVPLSIPRLAPLPEDLAESIAYQYVTSIDSQHPTSRYSEKPTIPTPVNFDPFDVIDLGEDT